MSFPVFFASARASLADTYNFVRKWPATPEFFDFNRPQGVAVDPAGNVYVVDTENHRIQRFDSSGNLGIMWGSRGAGDGQFNSPTAVAVDTSGNVYVADGGNNRIQKFSSTGIFQVAWGSPGTGNGQFDQPQGIAVDSSGDVYVSDSQNHRIQHFSPSGSFIAEWGSPGTGDGQFNDPRGIAVDSAGNIYVADRGNHRIQKLDSSGGYLTRWGSFGLGDSQFVGPQDVALDSTGNVYVTDTGNHRVQKFSSIGVFVTKWGSQGGGDGSFDQPVGIAINSTDTIYIADTNNHCIQKFDASGSFIGRWNAYGTSDGQFNWPRSVNLDSSGLVYVADSFNGRIQKFTPAGGFITKWGGTGSGDGQFFEPKDVAIDSIGNIYVADSLNHRIQKFDPSGSFIAKWGGLGTGDGQFDSPTGVAVDTAGNVYVADWDNDRIQKFTSSGTFLTKWGSSGSGDGQFSRPNGITVDSSGAVYVADMQNHRIQKFASTGTFITKWGSYGFGDGQFIHTMDVGVDSAGGVYVADWSNNRIQKFDSSGRFLTKWGSKGRRNAQFNGPWGLAVSALGGVYVADTWNARIQQFEPSTDVTPPTSPVSNPGFEAGDFAFWNASPKWSVTSTDAHSGTYSALYQPVGTGMFWEGESLGSGGISVGGGKWYTISAWIKQVGTEIEWSSLFGGARFSTGLNFPDGSHRGIPVLPWLFSYEAGSWAYRERTFYVPMDATEHIRFGLSGKALNLGAKILVDDVKLVENPNPPNTVAPGAIDTWHLETSGGFISPQEMVSDSQGNLWIGTGEEWSAPGGLIKWDPRTNSKIGHYPVVGSNIDTLFVSSTGEIWWASWCEDKVGAFDPISATSLGEITLATRTPDHPCGQVRPVSPVEASDGSFWFAENETAKITRWDRSTGITQGYSFPAPGTRFDDLIRDKNGKFWFSDWASGGIGSFDPVARTFGALYQVDAPNSMPSQMKLDEQGKIWYSLWQANKIGRLDPATGTTTTYPIPTPSSGPLGLAIDRLGNIWFAESWAGAIGKLDPDTGQITEYRKKESEGTKWVWADNKGGLYYGSNMPGNLKGGFLNRIKNTQPGSGVEVGLFDLNPAKDKVLATFDSITAPGNTDAKVSGPVPAPTGYALRGTTWHLWTTASYSGGVTVGLSYDQSQVANENVLRLLHWNGSTWQDITTSVDTAQNVAWGRATSLSPFAVAEDTAAPSAPTLAGFAPSTSEIDLYWAEPTDNVKTAGYRVFSADSGTEITHSPPSATSHVEISSSFAADAFYGYYVKAYDASSNISNPSNVVRIRPNPSSATTTPAGDPGQEITVQPAPGVSITFTDVTASGETTVTKEPAPPPPLNFQYISPSESIFYNISTTAGTTGSILVSIQYNDAGLSLEQEQAIQMLHCPSADCATGGWVDATVRPVDTTNNVVTGRVDHFSGVILAIPSPGGGPSLPSTGSNLLRDLIMALLFLAAGLAVALRTVLRQKVG